MNAAPGYENFSYLGIFCVGKVPSLLKFMQKMNPSKWYLWSMLSYLSIFFLPCVNIWMSVCNILCTDFCAFSLANFVRCIIVTKVLKSMVGFFLNETHKAANIYIISTPAVSSLSLTLSLSPNEEGKVMYFVFNLITF